MLRQMLFFTAAVLLCAVRHALKTKMKAVAIVVPIQPVQTPPPPPAFDTKRKQTCINKEETSFSTVFVDFSDLV